MQTEKHSFILLRLLKASDQGKIKLPAGLKSPELARMALDFDVWTPAERQWLQSTTFNQYAPPSRGSQVFAPVDDPPAPRKRDRLIITVATGPEHERLVETSGKYFAAYAERIGADFIVLKGKTQGWWGLEKFRIRPFVEQYERTMFVDADILIRDGAPDIFAVVPEAHIGMHDDWPFQCERDWYIHERGQLFESQGVPFWNPPHMRNTGVVVCDRLHADIWTPPPRPVPGLHCNEQFWIERLSRYYFNFALPIEFNTQWYMPGFFDLARSAWFIHLANCPPTERLSLMLEFLKDGNTREVDR